MDEILLACSGEGAPAAMALATTIGWYCFAVDAMLLLAIAGRSVRSGVKKLASGIFVALLLVHPAWTVSAIHGDCGIEKEILSLLSTGFALGVYIVAVCFFRSPKITAVEPTGAKVVTSEENPYRSPGD
ncbi:hypothetical protein [Aeoliella mucimassa]|uniref:Uncharacterized protein n=1 Tax=Aeoliella mucimassa TaxID=2527972 RepID=A0A518AI97_9BACT|nr:hypothetical protein [Aeoliella mucimassa]QDU54445.1 hypothetical protein Pan181_06270 [Aeoliella mucimassa]